MALLYHTTHDMANHFIRLRRNTLQLVVAKRRSRPAGLQG